MKKEFDFQIVEYDKFPDLVNLWNIWQSTTCFLSTDNCQNKQWDELVAYGKEHIKEVAEFIYDMFESGIEVSWPAMTLYDDCIGKPLVYAENGSYINPAWEPVQNAYKIVCGLQCGKIEANEETLQKFDLNQNKQND